MTATIHIDPAPLLAVLDERGWTQGTYGDDEDGAVCLHGAVRRCTPVPGDANIIEAVARRQGWGTSWNDDEDRTEADVRALLARGIDVTDEDLAETYGPQWRAVVSLVRRAAVMTEDEARRLVTARAAVRYAARDAAGDAAWTAAGDAAWDAARDAAGDAARDAARDAVRYAAWTAAGDAAQAAATWDLATPDGPYTTAHRDLLAAPWVSVMGPIPDIVEVTP